MSRLTSVRSRKVNHVARKCKVRGCKRDRDAKGLCPSHYRKMRRKLGLEPKQPREYFYDYSRSMHGRWTALKRATKDKKLSTDITFEYYSKLMDGALCEYCSGELNPTGHCLDRKDSSQGYTKENVVVCCITCNRIKNAYLTHEEMKAAMKAVIFLRRKT